MYIISRPCDISDLSHPGIGQIVTLRISELGLSTEEALPDIGKFIIVESGDTVTGLKRLRISSVTLSWDGIICYANRSFARKIVQTTKGKQ